MKPLLIKENTASFTSLMLKRKEFKFFPVNFHYHDDIELVLKLTSSGEMIVGNYVGRFNEGELFLLGGGLPHYWKNDASFYEVDEKVNASSIVAHFEREFLGSVFFKLPEMHSIDEMLQRAKRGVLFGKKATQEVATKFEELIELEGYHRLIGFINLLYTLSLSNDYILLSTEVFDDMNASFHQSEPIKKVYEYVMKNFKEDVSQTKAAELVGMNSSAFSRFFHRSTKKTFTHFVNEVRLSYASRLLFQGEMPIAEIAYECGFQNLSNFNSKFKSFFKQTPSAYKRSFQDCETK